MIAATAITNVRVFDGERLREPATVVLEDATISARTSADGALNADVVDGGGGTLLPGLIDTHVHVDKACMVLIALIGSKWATLTDKEGHRRLDDPDDWVRLEVQTALRGGGLG